MLRSRPGDANSLNRGFSDCAAIMDLYWLEQTEADVPPEDSWLGPREAALLKRMRFAKRHSDWRLGRWTAKRAIAIYLNASLSANFNAIEILPTPAGAPEVWLTNQPANLTISLSHRAGRAICAIAPLGGVVGCDLELIEPRSDGFVADYFTTEEQRLVARASPEDQPRLTTLIWSAKESALKALGVGLRFDTRSVSVERSSWLQLMGERGKERKGHSVVAPAQGQGAGTWQPLRVIYGHGDTFFGWWQSRDGSLRTVVGAPAPEAPISLEPASPAQAGRADW
jgi:4'-phosphopantetheinyl transferase